MKKRKISNDRKKKSFPVSGVVTACFVTTVILLVAALISIAAVKNLGFFKVKDIYIRERNTAVLQPTPLELPTGQHLDLSYLIGRNIFDVDLKKEAAHIGFAVTSFRKVKLIRILPNKIFVEYVLRKPVAYVKVGKYYSVSDDLVFLESSLQVKDSALTMITGLDKKISGVKTGARYNIKELFFAFRLMHEVRSNQELSDFFVQKIDVANPENITFVLMPVARLREALVLRQSDTKPVQPSKKEEVVGIEVKISQENLRSKISIIGSLLNQLKNSQNNIEYIDLRFGEPTIKLKENNNVKKQ